MNSGELKVDVPLAATEESDCEEFSPDNQQHTTPARGGRGGSTHVVSSHQQHSTPKRLAPNRNNSGGGGKEVKRASPRFNIDTGGDSVTGSLEDLVTSFDEKITACFQDYQEQVEKIAPVQVKLKFA